MGFATVEFLSVFFPLAMLACLPFVKRLQAQNVMLGLLSLAFFIYAGPTLVLVPIAFAVIDYYTVKAPLAKKTLLTITILMHVMVLVYYKYMGFIFENINALFMLSLPVPNVMQPIGLSFFTFRSISYVMDVHREKAPPAKNVGEVFLYIGMFPCLVAGPIATWQVMQGQLASRRMTIDGVMQGLIRFTFGLAKKVLLADVLAGLTQWAFSCPPDSRSAAMAWLGALAYTLQLYLDFSGYSDMAIGLGRVFGFAFPENFRRPLCAQSMRDFWRRWHMSLTDWFKQYVYIPLGGNRKGLKRTCLNLMVVFILTGLWHGAKWTYVVWGLWNGLFLLLERIGNKSLRGIAAHAYTLMAVLLGFVVFRAETLVAAGLYLQSMFCSFAMDAKSISAFVAMLTPMHITALITGIMVSFGLLPKLKNAKWALPLRAALAIVLLVVCYSAIMANGYRPFIYAQF